MCRPTEDELAVLSKYELSCTGTDEDRSEYRRGRYRCVREQCLRPVDGRDWGCTFPVTESSLKQ